MSLYGRIHCIVPVGELPAAVVAIRGLGRCVADPEEDDGCATLFQLQMIKESGGRPKTWFADVETYAGQEFAEIVLEGVGTKDVQALYEEGSSVRRQLAAALAGHRLVCGQLIVEDDLHLLDNRLSMEKRPTFVWPQITSGGEGADQMGAAYRAS